MPLCPKRAVRGGRCEVHLREYEKQRGTATQRGYDERWRVIRAAYLRQFPICEEPGCNRKATDVDHIDGRGPKGDNSFSNLAAMCHQHHSRKTVKQDGGFGR